MGLGLYPSMFDRALSPALYNTTMNFKGSSDSERLSSEGESATITLQYPFTLLILLSKCTMMNHIGWTALQCLSTAPG